MYGNLFFFNRNVYICCVKLNFLSMKKLFVLSVLLLGLLNHALAQNGAEIKFDAVSHDFGKFSEKNPVQTCTRRW